MIEVKNLYKCYGKKEVLSGLSFELYPSQIQGIVGENGSGKTTLFECIRNLTEYKGSVLIDRPAKIGYMPASFYYYPNMKGIEYIEFCLSARKLRIDKVEVASFNKLFELPLNEYAANYSTGMKKKLAFMAMLMQQNDIFLLDEPFNGLDLASCLLFKQILLHLREKNKMIFLSSHIISSLTDICNRILYIRQGTIRKIYAKEEFDTIENELLGDAIQCKLEAVPFLKM
jgi:ABC-2 type transport system ATP-binding protein